MNYFLPSLSMWTTLTLVLFVSSCALAKDTELRCSANNNHLDPASKKFISDCSEQNFCSGTDIQNATCVPKQCRRDEFPFGFSSGDFLPPLCARGTFCPDDGSGCRQLVSAGQPCELNRDDQCGAPLDSQKVGIICLRSICRCVIIHFLASV